MIFCENIVLVPYRPIHVPKYNQWMKSVSLQYLTGSEPLTLEEEFEMMSSWLSDPNKCTFIILDKHLFETTNSEIESMIGDINLFLTTDDNQLLNAEIEIMIAEESHRGLGKGKQALLSMMRFGVEIIAIKRFVAKIKYNNNSSQKLFTKFGFTEESRSDIFSEITYCLEVDDNWFESLKTKTKVFEYVLIEK